MAERVRLVFHVDQIPGGRALRCFRGVPPPPRVAAPSKRPREGDGGAAAPADDSVAFFYPRVARMMHSFADGPSPLPECVALVAGRALAAARAVLAGLREVLRASGRSTVRVGDFAAVMPDTTAVYFRWRRAKSLIPAVPAVAGGGDEEEGEGGGFDDDAEEGVAALETLRGGALEEEDDEEEREQLALLEAEADAAAREDCGGGEGGGSGGGACISMGVGLGGGEGTPAAGAGAPPAQPPPPPPPPAPAPSPPLAAFLERLAYANARTRGMTGAQYLDYAQARKASFLGASVHLRARFAALFPPPGLSRAALEVLAFVAHDGAGRAVEAAARSHHGGALPLTAPAPGAGEEEAPLPLAAYAAAPPPAPSPELAAAVAAVRGLAAASAQRDALVEARAAERAAGAQGRAAAEAVAAKWAAGGVDEDGDAAFLAGPGEEHED
jgi:hypothetical protein